LVLNARTGVSRLGPAEPGTAGGFWGKEEEEEEEEDAYKVELLLAVPVLMLSEFERPNIAVEARRFAPWNTGLDIATISLLLFVCCGREKCEEIAKYLRLLRPRPATIGDAGYCSQ
jgi:hypothetical protein